jgi:hypothetical protein
LAAAWKAGDFIAGGTEALLAGVDGELNDLLPQCGPYAVLATPTSAPQRNSYSTLGLVEASPERVADMLLEEARTRTAGEPMDEKRSWGHLRLFYHLARRYPRLMLQDDRRSMIHVPAVSLSPQPGSLPRRSVERVNEVGLPSFLGLPLAASGLLRSSTALLCPEPPPGALCWRGRPLIELEWLLVQLGAQLPSLEPGKGEGAEGRYLILDVASLKGHEMEAYEILQAPQMQLAAVEVSCVLRLRTSHGDLPPSACFLPHLLPPGLSLPTITGLDREALLPDRPVGQMLRGLGVQHRPNPAYFLEGLLKLASATSLEGWSHFDFPRNLPAAEAKIIIADQILSLVSKEPGQDAELQELVDGLSDKRGVLMPCAGGRLVPVHLFFATTPVESLQLSPLATRALPVVAEALGGALAFSAGNEIYLKHRPVLVALGAPRTLDAGHLTMAVEALARKLAGVDRRAAQDIQAGLIVLYEYLDSTQDELPGSLPLLTQADQGVLPASECILPNDEPTKAELMRRLEIPPERTIRADVLPFRRLLRACQRVQDRVPDVTCVLRRSHAIISLHLRFLSDAINHELGTQNLAVEIVTGDLKIRYKTEGQEYMFQHTYVISDCYTAQDFDSERSSIEPVASSGTGSTAADPLVTRALLMLCYSDQKSELGSAKDTLARLVQGALADLLQWKLGMGVPEARTLAKDVLRRALARDPEALTNQSMFPLGGSDEFVVPFESVAFGTATPEVLQGFPVPPHHRRGSGGGSAEGGQGGYGRGAAPDPEDAFVVGMAAERAANEWFQQHPERFPNYDQYEAWVSGLRLKVLGNEDPYNNVNDALGESQQPRRQRA